jgi:hypothetical protein
MFRTQPALRTFKVDYRNGERGSSAIEEAPDLEDLQQVALLPDTFPSLTKLTIANRRPFRWSIPYGSLFHFAQADDETAGSSETTADMRALLDEGWPGVRVRKALKAATTVDGAREWLITSACGRLGSIWIAERSYTDIDAPGIDDPDAGNLAASEDQDEGDDHEASNVPPQQTAADPAADFAAGSSAAQVADAPAPDDEAARAARQAQADADAVFAAALRKEESDRIEAERSARELARTLGVVEALRAMLALRVPPVELVCDPEGRAAMDDEI